MMEVSPYGADTQRYWDLRYDLFSRFDAGIQIDREGLFSAKPEKLAADIARRLPGNVVLDAFCGIGGSAIGFAKQKSHVVCTDIDHAKLSMASHNAGIYGVANKISFVQRDVLDLLSKHDIKFDSVYLDPPWGGPEYYKKERFTLDMFKPNGQLLIEATLSLGCPFAISVPKNFDMNEFFCLKESFFLEWHMLKASPLFATVYFRILV